MRLSANKQKNKAERAALDANALKTYVRLLEYDPGLLMLEAQAQQERGKTN